jgi:DNA-binding winged helix-turn-helix (wHTH) protein/tetratricopeptide (TPR) repeat protein
MAARVLYEFGPFTLDPLKRLLMRQGHAVTIPPRAVDVLIALVRHRGSVVETDDLMRAVWRGAIVEENNLSVSISALRKVLGESIRDHRYIVTIHRRGYTFVAAVNERSADAEPVEIAVAPGPPGRHQVVALPFEVIGERPTAALAALPQAVADECAARLGGHHHVAVLMAPPSLRPRDADPLSIARRLHAAYALSGTFRIDTSRVRVMARLLRTEDGTVAWGDAFDEGGSDVFDLEGRVVKRIVRGLAAYFEEDSHQRSARRSTESAEAHRDYVRGRYFWNKRTEEGLRKAIEHFERAIHADPDYALPYSGLADCYLLLSTYGAISPRQGVPRAVRAATRALEIDDTLAEACTSLGYARFAYSWRSDEAETYFRRAIELNPDYATGHHLYADHLAAAGRFNEAVESLQRALALDPLSLIINTDLGWVMFHARRFEQGIDQLKKTIEMDGAFPAARWVLGVTWLHAGEPSRAVKELEAARALAPHSPHILGSLAQALGVARHHRPAESVLRELRELGRRNYVSPYHYAVAHLGAGARDAAVRELRQAVAERAHWAAYFRVSPTLDALRDHPGFVRLLQRFAPLDGPRIEASEGGDAAARRA